MQALISCAYNMDTCCVELKYNDRCRIAIDTNVEENEFANNMFQRSELAWLIYNKPLEYVQLVFDGDLEKYAQGTPEHRLMD